MLFLVCCRAASLGVLYVYKLLVLVLVEGENSCRLRY